MNTYVYTKKPFKYREDFSEDVKQKMKLLQEQLNGSSK